MATVRRKVESGKERVELAELGFVEGPRGVHTSRTMMLAELALVMDSGRGGSGPRAVRAAIVEDNLLGKATRSGRINSATKLIDLYGFEPQSDLFAAFHSRWRESSASKPVLAVLMAQCRDAVLRESASVILETPIGAAASKDQFYRCLLSAFTSKYAETTLQSTTKNVASSWRQSQHIRGGKAIIRTKAPADFHALAFAALIGYLRGLRGRALLSSDWVRILDFEPRELEDALAEAHRHGLLTSRRVGEVIEITPNRYSSGRAPQ